MDEFLEVMDQLKQAQQNFNYADLEHIDIAIYQLKAAEELLAATIKELKEKREII
ncbi:hypothetical protein [Thermotalea metallivorans]|uniref:Uncharacterized protein n=1 Tax=Thermotalea metallivorans TaxID=520762 RepID=A0A140LCI4_9FIRM|nr:hypothetical protein [Thermotalea metallivorans]KXG78259.1 hypothetical protein AN619_02340 [Thermotalea metallivorans]